jgi:hypothetical protein
VDKNSLVKEQIAAGEILIRKAIADGIEITGGAWTQIHGDGKPYLYLVAPEVESNGVLEAYGKLGAVQLAIQNEGVPRPSRVEPFTVKLIPPSHELAQGIAVQHRRYPDEYPSWHTDGMLGGVYAECAYIYPAKLFAPQPAAAS